MLTYCNFGNSILRSSRHLMMQRRFKLLDNNSPRFLRLSQQTLSASTIGLNLPKVTSFWNLMKRYEDFIGISGIKEAQQKVYQAEKEFLLSQNQRRDAQEKLQVVHSQLKEVHAEIDKTRRDDPVYLDLVSREHQLHKQERSVQEQFKSFETAERDNFHRLSANLREAHEKERERGERTKYWSIIGSVVGAMIGILGTTINNRIRLREIKSLVSDSSDGGHAQKVLNELNAMLHAQQQNVHTFVTDLRSILANTVSEINSRKTGADLSGSPLPPVDTGKFVAQWDSIQQAIEAQRLKLEQEMSELRRMIAAEHGYQLENVDGTVDSRIVYVGPEMVSLLDRTEHNLEWKMKVNTLVGVLLVYGAFAITLPILYSIFGGT